MNYFWRIIAPVICLGLLLSYCASSFAQSQNSEIKPDTIALVEKAGLENVYADIGFHTDVGPYAVYAIDLETPMDLQQTLKRKDWQRVGSQIIDGAKLIPDGTRPSIDFAEKKYPIWVYAQLKNNTGHAGTWRLDTRRREFKDISIFAVRNTGEIQELMQSTWHDKFSDRVIKNRFLATEISLAADETVDIYVRYIGNYNHTIRLKVASVSAYQAAYAIDGAWLAVFYATMATIIGMTLIFSAYTGWRTSFAFILYMVFGTAAYASESGHFFQFISPDNQNLSISLFNTVFSLMYFSSLLLAKAMFDLKKFSPFYDRFITGVMVFLFIYAFIFPIFSIYPDQNEILDILFDIVMMGSVTLHIVNGYAAMKTRQSGGVAFMIGGIVMIALTFAVRPGLFGYIDGSDRTFPFGVIGISESTIFAIAMLQRAIGIRKERDEAVRDKLKITHDKLRLSDELRDREKAYEKVRTQALQRKERLASVSHDILQPLTSLRASLADLRIVDEEKIQHMHNAVDYLETLARDSLQAKTAKGGDVSNLETFPLTSVTNNIATMFEGEAIAKGLDFNYSPVHVQIESDPIDLMRILSNLMSNAIKHSDHGQISLNCELTAKQVLISIGNTGVAMSVEDISQYMQAYEKGERSDGTGLGLYQVKKMCENLGYKFEMTSGLKQGTKAHITITL